MSKILQGFCYFIAQVMFLLSVLFLIRGHNYPGGGFIGALIATTAIALNLLTFSRIPQPLFLARRLFVIIGLLLLVASMLMSTLNQLTFFTAMWTSITLLNTKIKLGSPLLFDIGIYLSVIGSMTWLLTELEFADDS